jgi:hypothetical protein
VQDILLPLTERFNDLEKIRFYNIQIGEVIAKALDIPVIKKGFWRLSTADNFAYHGECFED